MGRFETTVDFYRFREPYPPAFFKEVAAQLALTRAIRMLDVGCGPGNLAIGFTPYVATCTAIDVEAEMLRAARQAAGQAGVNIDFRQVPIQQFDAQQSTYDFVTVGRALHWLPADPTVAVFERIIAPGGHIALCGARHVEAGSEDWAVAYKRVRDAWSPNHDESCYHPDLDQWFARSRFRRVKDIVVDHAHLVTVNELILRALSFSTTSPAVVGDKRPQFEAELKAALKPFARSGEIEEKLKVKATIFA